MEENDWERYEQGCHLPLALVWRSMAQEVNLDVSVAMAKGKERLSRQRMGLDRNSDSNESNADWHWKVQLQARFFLVKSIRGWAILE